MKRRLALFLFLILAVVASVMLGACSNDGSIVIDGLRYISKDDGTLELKKCERGSVGVITENDAYAVQVPKEIDGTPVTSVAAGAFEECALKSVVLPEGVTSMGARAFSKCGYLAEVSLPSTLEAVSGGAFYDCENLNSVTFKEGLQRLGGSAFHDCVSLTTINLPQSCASIGEGCFSGSGLTSFSAEGITFIGERAFSECHKLETAELPDGLKTVSRYCFRNCEKLTRVKAGGAEIICDGAFYDCAMLSVAEIEAATFIGEQVFVRTSLSKVKLPEIKTIGYAAFASSKVKSVTIGKNLENCDKDVFFECSDTFSELIIDSPVPAGFAAGLHNLNKLRLGDGVTEIGASAFSGCSALKNVQFPSTLKKLGEGAFMQSGVIALSFPSSLTSIGARAFENCKAVKSISFSEGLESVGMRAFAVNSENKLTIIMPDSVRVIGDYCFSGVKAERLEINQTIAKIDNNALNGLKATHLKIPANLTYSSADLKELTLFGDYDIQPEAFTGCIALAKVHILSGATAIGEGAFKGCNSLREISVPDTVTDLGEGAFQSCSSLTGVNFGGTVEAWDALVDGVENFGGSYKGVTVSCLDGSTEIGL